MNQLNQADARAFIIALNNVAQYVPPMLMQQVTGNSICRIIEALANNPETTTQGVQAPIEERLKPHIVS